MTPTTITLIVAGTLSLVGALVCDRRGNYVAGIALSRSAVIFGVLILVAGIVRDA